MSSYCENIDQYFEYPYDETPTEAQPPFERFLIDEYSYLSPDLQQASSFSVIPSSLRDSDTYRHPMGPMNDWDPNMIMLENIEPEVQMEVPQYVNPKDVMPHTDRYGLAHDGGRSFIKPPSYTSSRATVTFAQPPPSPPKETLRRSRRTSSTTRAPPPPKSNLKSPRKPAPRASHSFQPYQLPTPPAEGAGPSRPRANPPKRELPTRTRKPSLRARGGDAY